MNNYTYQKQQNQTLSAATVQRKSTGFYINDNRPETIVQRKLATVLNNTVQPLQFSRGSKTQKAKRKKEAEAVLAAGRAGGAARAVGFGGNWAKRSWRDHVKDLGMAPAKGGPMHTETGKTIFNLTNGHQIVIDQAGKYWRHYDGAANYFNADGVADADLARTHFRH